MAFKYPNQPKLTLQLISTSYWVPFSILFAIRLLFAVFGLGFFLAKISYSHSDVFRYLTNFSWFGITLYFSMTVVVSILFMVKKKDEELGWWSSRLFEFVFSSTQAYAPVVTIVFWVLLRSMLSEPGHDQEWFFLTVAPHVANIIMIQLELWCCKMVLDIRHIWYVCVISLFYASYSWVLHYCFDVAWPYPFFEAYLDLRVNAGWAVLGCIVILTAFSVVYVLVWLEFWLKIYLTHPVDNTNTDNCQKTPDVESTNVDKPDKS